MNTVKRKPHAADATEIIYGIKLDIRGSQLASRLAARIEWHQKRQEAVATQIARLTETASGDEGAPIAIRQRDSLRLGLERQLAEHEQRATFLAFLRDHLAPQQVYRLDSLDFRMIEILPEGI